MAQKGQEKKVLETTLKLCFFASQGLTGRKGVLKEINLVCLEDQSLPYGCLVGHFDLAESLGIFLPFPYGS